MASAFGLNKTAKFCLLVALGASLSTAAMAKTAPQPTPALPTAPTYGATESPVMIIRFNEKNVYFLNPLRQIVGKIDSGKPSAKYELKSVTPANVTKNPGNGKDFDENLQAVVTVLGRLGVTSENITTSTEVSNVENQEIQLFVR